MCIGEGDVRWPQAETISFSVCVCVFAEANSIWEVCLEHMLTSNTSKIRLKEKLWNCEPSPFICFLFYSNDKPTKKHSTHTLEKKIAERKAKTGGGRGITEANAVPMHLATQMNSQNSKASANELSNFIFQTS